MSLIKRKLIPFMCDWCLLAPLDTSSPRFVPYLGRTDAPLIEKLMPHAIFAAIG